MKKFLLTMICLVTALTLGAQTQQGYVKTPGRLSNNGQVIAGKRLSGATVQVKGRSAVVSDANGTFSFPIPANKFTIQSVKKQGYVLTDPEATTRQYSYTTTPLILVMETPNQQADNKLANERKIRRTLQRQLQEKEDEIEAMKAQNKITQEEYQKKLQQLYAEQESNEKLISDMAERYSQIDFDQLDEFNLRISDCIINGRLTEADSLLRSKGDINTRIAQLNQHHDANEQAQATLDKSKAMEQKNRDDIAQDCYNYFQKFLMENQNDSAAHYLELRAAIDTTNIEWQNAAGRFIESYLANYNLAMEFYQRGLHQSITQNGEQNDYTATFYNNIGSVYSHQGDYSQALEYHQKALGIWEQLYGPDHPIVTIANNNIGNVYYDLGDYEKATEYYEKSLAIAVIIDHLIEKGTVTIDEQTNNSYKDHLATSINNFGNLLGSQSNDLKALELFNRSLAIWESIYGQDHPKVALSYNNIGWVYNKLGDYTQALEKFQKALEIFKRVLGLNHPYVAATYNNIGNVFYEQGDYNKALEYFQKALDIRERVYGTDHPDVAFDYNYIGAIYYHQCDYAKALEYFKKSQTIYESLSDNDEAKTRNIKTALFMCEYKLSSQSDDIGAFLQEHCFIATVADGDTPARQQEMKGEYILLEFADWTETSSSSLFDKNRDFQGKPKDIVVLKDGIITEHHFENAIGAHFEIKQISKEERKQINKLYNQWKNDNKN